MIKDAADVTMYILLHYGHARKIIEVGIGSEDSVYQELEKNLGGEIVSIDIIPRGNSVFDDVFEPDLTQYQGAGLIYSIRPNPELIPPIQKIAQDVGADLLIRPLTTDSCHKLESMKLVNFGKAVLWVETR